MDIRETLRALPRSYDDFVESTAECMEEYSDVNDAVLQRLQENPAPTPSDIIKIVCEKLGMLEDTDTKPVKRPFRVAML